MAFDLPPGCKSQPLSRHEKHGGCTPLGPSWALNAKRELPMLAGLTNPKTHQRTVIFKAQRSARNYFECDDDGNLVGNLVPDEWIQDKACYHMLHNNSVNNLMLARLPRPIHGNIKPHDILLEMYWKVYSDKNPFLSKMKRERMDLQFWHQAEEEVKTQFFSYITDRDQTAETLQQHFFGNSLVQKDALGLSADELASHRVYGKNGNDEWIIEPRQRLKELSMYMNRAAAMVRKYYDSECAELKKLEAQIRFENRIRNTVSVYDAPELKEITQLQDVLEEKYSQGIEAVIVMGLQSFDHAYTSPRYEKFIPKGWREIYSGTLLAIREAGKQSALNVDPTHVDAGLGTANIAFAFNREMTHSDFSPFGHWRQFLITQFTTGAAIDGPDVRLMLEGYMQCFEVAQDVSTYLLYFGGAGIGKSLRPSRLKRMLCKGWIQNSGGGSNLAGTSTDKDGSAGDGTNGKVLYYGERTPTRPPTATPHPPP